MEGVQRGRERKGEREKRDRGELRGVEGIEEKSKEIKEKKLGR